MKYIALLLGLALTAPAMAQNGSAGGTQRPAVQDAKKKEDPKPKPKPKPGVKPNGGGIDPGLLRRFDTNGDGRLSDSEKLAARRRIAEWRDRQRGDKPKPQPGDRGSRGSRGNGPRPTPGVGGNGNGPKPQPGGRGSRGGRGNGPRPTPGTGGSGNGPKPQPGRGSRGGRGNGPRPTPGN